VSAEEKLYTLPNGDGILLSRVIGVRFHPAKQDEMLRCFFPSSISLDLDGRKYWTLEFNSDKDAQDFRAILISAINKVKENLE